MLDIAVIIILILATFVAVAWYANRSSKQRTKLLEEIDNIEPEMGDSGEFGALFEQELNQQSADNNHFEVDAEPQISISEAGQQKAPTRREEPRINITIDDEIKETVQDDDAEENELEANPVNTSSDELNVSKPVINDWDMVISFTVMARDGGLFSGKSVKAALESLDLHFGDLQIYHRSLGGLNSQTLFSVANILDPGTLNPESFATMKTPGLLIFARLPGPVNGLALFDDLLDAAQKMTDKLDGTLCDESRQTLNQSTIESMRSRILNLNLQLQAEQSNYNNDYSN